LVLRDVSLRRRGADSLSDLDLAVRSGEIVAVVALGGNGLEALEDVASGCAVPDRGEVLALGRELRSYGTRELRSSVMAYLPTDREGRGLCARASVAMNAVSSRLFSYSAFEYALGLAPLADASATLAHFDVRSWERRRVDTLSGGNRQRVVAARELSGPAPIVIAANPAQGLDRSAKSALFARLASMRSAGSAVLILSSDPEDAAELADRSFALYRGGLIPIRADGAQAFSAALTGAAP
jgi:simple sugar transport system ATP-binding protein